MMMRLLIALCLLQCLLGFALRPLRPANPANPTSPFNSPTITSPTTPTPTRTFTAPTTPTIPTTSTRTTRTSTIPARAARATSTSLFAQTQIVFSPGNIIVQAKVGDTFESVAKAAGMPGPAYDCRKGECGTCEAKVDGKWVKTCQMTIPSIPRGEIMRVTVRPAGAVEEVEEKKVEFFSPKSFLDGVWNNGLGVIGFVMQGLAADEEFDERMAREAEQEKRLKQRKAEKGGG